MTGRIGMMAIAVALGGFALVGDDAEAVTVRQVVSPGGIQAWHVEDYTVPIVTINFAFRGGASQESDDKAGLANLMSGLLDEGAGDFDSKAFQTALQEANIELSFDAGKDAFYGTMRTLVQNKARAFELAALSISEPRFDDEPVERIRGQIVAGLRRAETDPNELASRAWGKAMFGDHPYARPTEGSIETLGSITSDDLRTYHAQTFARDNLVVGVVGAISADELATALDRIFGALPAKAELRSIPDIEPTTGERASVELAVPQTVIRLGGPGLKRNDPDFIPAFVANHILGGGSFSSRLYKEIREDRGLAYSVGTGLVPYDHAGAYIGAAATRSDAADEAIDIMRREIERFAQKGPTEDELTKAKSFLTGSYALRFDSSAKIARQLVGIQLDRLGIDYFDKRNDLVNAVTMADIQRAAARIYKATPTIVTVGPAASDG